MLLLCPEGVVIMEFIKVELPKCVVYLSPYEINKLLAKDPELFQEALRRGKAFTRHNQQKDRERQKWEQEGFH